MDVSIVIVNYNTRRFLDECIQSIKRETSVSHEIIVVDNASTDDSCAMVRAKHPDVHLIENHENVGFAKANNQGFALAKGRYYFMLNPDTVVIEKAIDKLIAFMDANPDVGICGPKNIGPDGSLQYSCDHFPSIWNTFCSYANLANRYPKSKIFGRQGMRYWDYAASRDVERIMGCSLLTRASVFKSLGGLDERFFMYFEETDLCFRASKALNRIVFVSAATIIHFGGASAKNSSEEQPINRTLYSHYLTSQYYFYSKHYGLIPMLAIRCLDFCYGVGIIVKNIFRGDRHIKKLRIAKGKALCVGASAMKTSAFEAK